MQKKKESEIAQSCPTLCDPMDCSLPGSSAHGIFQARVLELPFPFPGDLPDPGTEPTSPALAGGLFATRTTWEALSTYYFFIDKGIFSNCRTC